MLNAVTVSVSHVSCFGPFQIGCMVRRKFPFCLKFASVPSMLNLECNFETEAADIGTNIVVAYDACVPQRCHVNYTQQ